MNRPNTREPEDLLADDGPFASDLDYIQCELLWVEARAMRIGAERALDRIEEEDTPRTRRRRNPFEDDEEESPRVLHRRAKSKGKLERHLRSRLDARLAAHRASDATQLALDEMAESFGLDAFERGVALLAVAPFFSRRFEQVYGQMVGPELYEGLTVETAFTFGELTLVERIERRATFGAKAPLVREDVVSISQGPRFCGGKELLDFEITMSNRTFAFLVGRRELEDEFLEFSSLEEPKAGLDRVVLDPDDKRRILSVVERHDAYLDARTRWGFDELITYGRGTLMLFSGPSGTGKTMTARAVHQLSSRREKPFVEVACGALPDTLLESEL